MIHVLVAAVLSAINVPDVKWQIAAMRENFITQQALEVQHAFLRAKTLTYIFRFLGRKAWTATEVFA